MHSLQLPFVLLLFLSLWYNGLASGSIDNKRPIDVSQLESKVGFLTSIVESLVADSKDKANEILILKNEIENLKLLATSGSQLEDVKSLKETVKYLLVETSSKDYEIRKLKHLDILDVSANTQKQHSHVETDGVLVHQTDVLKNSTNLHSNETSVDLEINSTSSRNARINSRPKRVPEISSNRLVFHAILTANEDVRPHSVLEFKKETIDTWNSYNGDNGIFTVPEDGLYVLTWTIYGGHNSMVPTKLMINGQVRGSAFVDSEHVRDLHTSTGIVVAHLSQGDLANIQIPSSGSMAGYIDVGRGDSTFSGWKIE